MDTYFFYAVNAVGHHIDFISKDLIPNSYGWLCRNTASNNGTAATPNPFLASLINTTLNNYYANLPTNLKSHIIKKRFLLPSRYSASNASLTDDIDAVFGEYNYLWLPTEAEVWGMSHWSTRGNGTAGSRKYPIFADQDQIIKADKGVGHTRSSWWTASATSNTSLHFCHVAYNGYAGYTSANDPNFGAPLCFRFQ